MYHDSEGGIEKLFQGSLEWHHEACRIMTNGDLERGIFLSHPYMNKGLFNFCAPLN